MLESHKVWAAVSLCLRDGLEVKAEAVRSEVEANIKKQLSGCRASLITNAPDGCFHRAERPGYFGRKQSGNVPRCSCALSITLNHESAGSRKLAADEAPPVSHAFSKRTTRPVPHQVPRKASQPELSTHGAAPPVDTQIQ